MYFANWLIRTTVTAIIAFVGVAPIAILFYPWPIANFWWRGQRANAYGLILSAAVGVFLGIWVGFGELAWLSVFYAVAVAALGILLGEAFLYKWHIGKCVTFLSLVLFAIASLNNLLYWDEVKASSTTMFRSFSLQFETLQADEEEASPAQLESMQRASENLRWMHEHVEYFAFGSLFGSMFLLSTFLVSLLNRAVRNQEVGLTGRFADLRPPDALVWLAILATLLAMADFYWQMEIARILSWNTGVALSVIYWLNGVACAVYFVTTLQLNIFLVIALLLFSTMPSAMMIYMLLGFFDTWLELRSKVDRLAAFNKKIADEMSND